MKTFKQFLTEQAPQPTVYAIPMGTKLAIKPQADGINWTNTAVVQITPTETADQYNLELANKNTISVVLTPDQTRSITNGDEVVLRYDSNEYVFNGFRSLHQVTEEDSYVTYQKEIEAQIKTLEKKFGKSKKDGRQDWKFSINGQDFWVGFGGLLRGGAVFETVKKGRNVSAAVDDIEGKDLTADFQKFVDKNK